MAYADEIRPTSGGGFGFGLACKSCCFVKHLLQFTQ